MTVVLQTVSARRPEHAAGLLGAGVQHDLRAGCLLRVGRHPHVAADRLPQPPRDLRHAAVWDESADSGLLSHL